MFTKWKKLYKALSSHLYEREKYITALELEKEVLKSKIEELSSMPMSTSSTIPRVVYDKFKGSMPNSMVGDDSSAGAIGYKLGVTHVLMRMEEQLVV